MFWSRPGEAYWRWYPNACQEQGKEYDDSTSKDSEIKSNPVFPFKPQDAEGKKRNPNGEISKRKKTHKERRAWDE